MKKTTPLPILKIVTLLIFILAFSLQYTYAQQDTIPLPKSMQKEKNTTKKRPKFLIGGGMGIQFGNYNAIEVLPQIGVYATPWLLVALTGEYSYMWSGRNLTGGYTSNVWGIGAYLQPCIVKKLLIHLGYDYSSIQFRWKDGSPTQNQDFHTITAGLGIKQYLTKRSYFYGLVLMNLYQGGSGNLNGTYSTNYYPFIRIGVGIDI